MDDVHGSGSPALAASRYLMQPPANNVETRCRSSAHLAIAVLTGDVATGSHGLAPIAPRAVRFAIGCLTFAGLGFIRLWWRRLRGLSPGSRVSSAVEQRFCKPLVGSSILSPGTNKIRHFWHSCASNPCRSVSQPFPLRFNGLQ
jgi:hypothetical protein